MEYTGEDGWGGGDWNQTDEKWDDFDLSDFSSFNKDWISLSRSVLKEDGAVWIFGTYHNIGYINVLLQEHDFDILNEIIWFKSNAFPNLSGRRFAACHESILWASKHENSNYTFNYQKIKEDKFKKDSLDSYDKQVRSIWRIPTNKTDEELTNHPTQKPESVIERIIESTSVRGDTILDPFMGSGTTAVVAERLGREWIGIENDEEYIQMANNRLKNMEEVSSIGDW